MHTEKDSSQASATLAAMVASVNNIGKDVDVTHAKTAMIHPESDDIIKYEIAENDE